MIFDKIENADLYKGINSRIAKALNYLQNTDFSDLKNGKHEIDGDAVFSLINEYDTKNNDDNLLESHLKYIDVQYVAEGIEQIGITSFTNQKTFKSYDNADDYMLFKEPYNLITLNKGMFAIFFPDDLHMPGLNAGKISKVKKVVVKVKL